MKLFNWSDLHEAVAFAPEVPHKLIASALRDAKTRDHYSPLHIAAMLGREEAVAALLKAGASGQESVDKYSGNALNLALLRQHWGVAKQLMARGVYVDSNGVDFIRLAAAMHAGARCKRVNNTWVIDKQVLDGEGAELLKRLPGSSLKVQPAAFSDQDKYERPTQSDPLCLVLRKIERGEIPIDTKEKPASDALFLCLLYGHLDVALALVKAGAPVNTSHDPPPLISAVEAGDEALVEAMLAAGANVDSTGMFKRTGLMLAAKNRHEGIVKRLVEAGADTTRVDEYDKTAREHAGNAPWAETLLSAGLDDRTPEESMFAHVEAGDLDGLTKALQAGADPRASRDGHSVLHRAIVRSHATLIEPLLEAGADPNAKTSQGDTALALAVIYMPQTVPSMLAADASHRIANKHGATPLHIAARYGSLVAVEALLKANADLEATDNAAWRPLHTAVYYGRRDVTKALLQAKASPSSRIDSGWTPLMFAAKKGLDDLIPALLEAAPELLNATNQLNETAAFLAAEENHAAALRALSGADLEIADAEGRTPLLIAAQKGHLAAFEALRAMGAATTATDKQGADAEALAKANHHTSILKALNPEPDPKIAAQVTPEPAPDPKAMRVEAPPEPPAEEDVPMPSTAYKAAKAGAAGIKKYLNAKPNKAGRILKSVVQDSETTTDLVKLILGYKATPDSVGTAIGYCAQRGRDDLLALLLAQPYEIGDRDVGMAVYGAVFKRQPSSVRALLEGGLSGDRLRPGHEVSFFFPDPPEDGAHPLLLAVHLNDAALVSALLEGGVEPNFCTHRQRTALDMARALECDPDVVDTLKAHGAVPIHDDLLDLAGAAILGRPARVAALAPHTDHDHLDNAVRLASEHGQRDVLEVLIADSEALRDSALGKASYHGRLDFVRWLLEDLKADLHAKLTYADKTALHFAAYGGHAEVAAYLIAQGADVNAKDKDDAMPLHDAARGKHPAVVEVLLRHGADPKARCDEGKNALAWSKKYHGREEARAEVERLLKAAGTRNRTPASWKRALKKKLKPHARPCHKLKTRKGAGAARASRFGGHPWLAADESWPSHQGEPALFLFQVDLAELPVEAGQGLLRVFIKPDGGFALQDTTCMVTQAIKGDVVTGSNPLSPRQLTGFGKATQDLPGAEAHDLVKLDPAEVEHLPLMTQAGDKVGGWPHWIQDASSPKGFGRFVLQVDTGGALAFSYGDSGIGILLQHDTDDDRFHMVWQSL